MKKSELRKIVKEEIDKVFVDKPISLSEVEIQDRQRRLKEYNDDLDKMIELGKQLIKSYGREI